MKKYLVFISILFILAACDSSEKSNLSYYENKELGLSFSYPSEFKIYQADEDEIRIDTGYTDPVASLVEIVLYIKRSNKELETVEQIESKLQAVGWQDTPILIEKKRNYELFKFGEQYYILSEKGTFIIYDSLEDTWWKERFQKEGLYDKYRFEFDQIRNSIKIIE